MFTQPTIPSNERAMMHSSARRLLSFLLAVFVTLSMSLSVVQASVMASQMAEMTEMAAMPDMGSAMSGDCRKCPGKSQGAAMIAACGSICVAPAAALLSQDPPVTFTFAQIDLLKRHSLLRGRVSPPDPYPPRSNDIG